MRSPRTVVVLYSNPTTRIQALEVHCARRNVRDLRWEEDSVNPKKLKEKDRRRARKLAEEAWEAVNQDNLDLAEKIIRRAVAAQLDNPVLWNDQGMILMLRGREADAAEAFRSALSLAPTFAEPFANLATLRARQGFLNEAVALQEQAVRHAPDNARFAEQLEAYRSLTAKPAPAKAEAVPFAPARSSTGVWPARMANIDWEETTERLTRDGCVLIPNLLDKPTCSQLSEMFDDESHFGRMVVMDRPDFGLGEYRYFRAPIPELVDQLRRAMFPHVAAIANTWQELFGKPERYPGTWEEFRAECARAGQTTPTAILLRYRAGGFNALHRDLRGGVFFPIQLAVVLSPRADPAVPAADGFQGGNFLFADVPETRRSRRREIAAGLGDAVLFCTRDRPVSVGGAWGLQPVKHGVTQITAGTRYVLGVPFHEYR